MLKHLGLDVGSTTVKLLVLSEGLEILHSVYKRHRSDVIETVRQVLSEAYSKFKNDHITINVTGSGGLFVEENLGIEFVQEVVASTKAIRTFIPETDVVIELGGEDAKIIYLRGSVEQRMNSICAGGTGAFIDQMSSLMEMDAGELNEKAKNYKQIYPIASRCGVFAKTDIQALMNQGATKEDLSASVLQSVANQTVSNLAQGRPIEGNIAFLGGPLHFLSELRTRFVETLGEDNTYTYPENSQLYVAMGAALESRESKVMTFKELRERLDQEVVIQRSETNLGALFNSEEEISAFKEAHKNDVKRVDLASYQGPAYLGIDAGSTTSKVILLDKDANILYEHYDNNLGKPMDLMVQVLKDIYSKMPQGAYIASSGVTGYGEDFLKAGLKLDHGEVETIAHYRAAKHFRPDVDFIIDIGGQDIKAMKIADDRIESIQLNEACSSGCGSFIETFASSLGMNVVEFHEAALRSRHPVDLGSRCTVFMNSKVKQAQKEGASVEDIAAGLCYSVIRNALQKVIKLRDPKDLGDHIVVQGGTFLGDGILRAFEKVSERVATRPSIAGLMGAFGMALIAREKSTGVSTILEAKELEDFEYRQSNANCRLCSNNCTLTINHFPDGSKYITGNRCEKGAGVKREGGDLPNIYKYKYDRLFSYEPIPADKAKHGTVGLPRVLNMYENYPFWYRFFTELGFSVVLSNESTRQVYERGMEFIPSETACYPAKISHGHIEDLVDKGVDMIFYPAVFYEEKEHDTAQNHLNCPVVAGYPDLIKNNSDNVKKAGILYKNPFVSFDNRKKLKERLYESLAADYPITSKDISKAIDLAYEELKAFREDIAKEGSRILKYLDETGQRAIVLAGRPYHVDPEINHGLPELITSLGFAVLSEDALAYEFDEVGELRVLDQWVYHTRLYRAADFVGKSPNLEMIQLNSFGCGLDAVTTDQVNEILEAHGKIYTVLKIDEVSNMGASKIRIRSLAQAVECGGAPQPKDTRVKHIEYTEQMNMEGYTILCPQMLEIHFQIYEDLFRRAGMNIVVLPEVDAETIDYGLKYVNNDACYPSITVVGQMMKAIHSGKYDTDKLALIMAQTGGACRASNYVGFIRKALKDSGYDHIPVIALSAQGIESHSGFSLDNETLHNVAYATFFGDLIMRIANATRPYEVIKGSTDRLVNTWIKRINTEFNPNPSFKKYKKYVKAIVRDFDMLEVDLVEKPKVGIVGEILVKYLPEANNHLQKTLEEEGAEVIISDLVDFLNYCLRNEVHKASLFGKSATTAFVSGAVVKLIDQLRKPINQALKKTRFPQLNDIEAIESKAKEFVSLGNQYGEGWLLTGEMVDLIEMGAANIVCTQPFGCLPNHITGKGVTKAIREKYPQANIVAIDYDPGASEVNQINRIKLMMSTAKENLKKEKEGYFDKLATKKDKTISM